MATVYPDTEILLVSLLKDALPNDVFVSVKKPDASVKPYPGKIVQIRSDGGNSLVRDITRIERIGINVFASKYSDASALAIEVDSILRASAGGQIKRVENILSPTRVPNEGTEEQRYMTYELVVKASDA